MRAKYIRGDQEAAGVGQGKVSTSGQVKAEILEGFSS